MNRRFKSLSFICTLFFAAAFVLAAAPLAAQKVETDQTQVIQVRLSETDGEDKVVVCALP